MTICSADYHRSTSYNRRDMSGRALDWSNQPSVFKSYIGQKIVSLPDDQSFSSASLWEILSQDAQTAHPTSMDVNRLARVLVLTHTITAKARYGGTNFFYRSVASAGALYPFELYVAATNVEGLSPGVYHHQPATRSLAILRQGFPGQELRHVAPDAGAGVVFFISTIFFRSSWKYRDRAYRYHLLDSGHFLENLTLALKSEHLQYRILVDFNDAEANRFLGFDPEREVCLAEVAVANGQAQPQGQEVASLEPPGPQLAVCSRVSPRETLYPAIKRIHEASSVCKRPSAKLDVFHDLGLDVSSWFPVEPAKRSPTLMSLPETLIKRRSMRNFVRATLPIDHLLLLLEGLCFEDRAGQTDGGVIGASVAVGFLAANIENLQPGFYLVDRRRRSFGLVRQGLFMNSMAHICLDQQWLANCALHFLFLTNLRIIDAAYGPRGYRYAMLHAGRLGQRMYLATTSMHLGCCGIGAFYDSEASDLLGLNSDSYLLYLVAAGPVRKWMERHTGETV